MDHSQCRERFTPQWAEHVCPPCPHGHERGGTWWLGGNPEVNRRQRELKLQAIEQVTCADHWTKSGRPD